jgi:hypothetical protein
MEAPNQAFLKVEHVQTGLAICDDHHAPCGVWLST